MVTAPQSSRFSFPPVLNTAIDSSSLRLSLGLQEDEEGHGSSENNNAMERPLAAQSTTSLASVAETPVAGHFNSSATSLHSDPAGAPYCHLNVSISSDDIGQDEDWAKSVLMAADSEGGWKVNNLH